MENPWKVYGGKLVEWFFLSSFAATESDDCSFYDLDVYSGREKPSRTKMSENKMVAPGMKNQFDHQKQFMVTPEEHFLQVGGV